MLKAIRRGRLGIWSRLRARRDHGTPGERRPVRPRGKTPRRGQGDLFRSESEGEQVRAPGDPAPKAVVYHAHRYRIFALAQNTRRNGIDTHRVMMTGSFVAADAPAVHPGHIHVVDLA